MPRDLRTAHAHLTKTLGGALWAMKRSALDALIAGAKAGPSMPGEDPPAWAILAHRCDYIEGTAVKLRDGVGILSLDGPLMRGSDCWWYGTCYEMLALDFVAALENPSVRAIVLECNSPGGDVNGMIDFAELVFAARGRKPIIAVAGGLAASAAYFIASAADEVVIGPNGEVGSLGVFCAVYDWSKALEEWGIKEFIFTSEQSPNKNPDPATAEGAAAYQALVNTHGRIIVERVAKYRGISEADVLGKYGQGALFVGDEAVTATIADRVALLEDVVQELASDSFNNLQSGRAQRATSTEQPMKATKGAPAGAKAITKGAAVTVNVARNADIAEGDRGTIAEVREGATVVAVETDAGRYAWLLAEEVAEYKEDDDEDKDGEGDDDDTEETEEEKAAATLAVNTALAGRLSTRHPAAIAHIQREAAAVESKRVLGIMEIGAKTGLTKVAAECIADPKCTVEAAAHRLLTEQGKANGAHLTSILAAEAALAPPAAHPRTTDGNGAAPEQTNAQQVAKLLEANDPRYRKPAGAAR